LSLEIAPSRFKSEGQVVSGQSSLVFRPPSVQFSPFRFSRLMCVPVCDVFWIVAFTSLFSARFVLVVIIVMMKAILQPLAVSLSAPPMFSSDHMFFPVLLPEVPGVLLF